MNVDFQVPFYSNTADDTHCFQATLRMVLKFFYPDEEYTWDELDHLSAKAKGLWTWPPAALIFLKEKGLDLKIITPFEYNSFIHKGGDFLIEKYGPEVGGAQIKHSDIKQEQELARKLLEVVPIVARVPEIDEIFELLDQGFLVMCNVNSRRLNKQEGYVGHFILVKSAENGQLVIHDPGLPAQENRVVDPKDFEAAWAFPNEEAKDVFGFRQKN